MQKGVNCTYFRCRHASLQDFFSVQNNVCYCSNIDCFFESLESEHDSNEWRLSIDSSKASLEAVLLNNGNEKPSIPLTPATALKENHETTKLILLLINYSVCKWNICGDLKVIGLFIGMQMGYTNAFCVFVTATMMSDIKSKNINLLVKRLFQEGSTFTVFHKLIQRIYIPTTNAYQIRFV